MDNSIEHRTGVRNCLLCLKSLSGEQPEETLISIPGAESVTRLQLNLQHYFILRKILNLPVNWCEEALRRWEENGVGQGISVCELCSITSVQKAWDLHQNIVKLERKLWELREQTIATLKTEVMAKRKKRRKRRAWRSEATSGTGTEEEIYEQLFPAGNCTNWNFNPVTMQKIRSNPSFSIPGYEAVKDIVPKLEYSSDLEMEDSSALNFDDFDPSSASDSSFKPTTTSSLKKPKNRKQIKPSSKKRLKAPPAHTSSKRKKRFVPKVPWNCCTICPQKYIIPEELASHMEAHKMCSPDLICAHCCFPTMSLTELERHITIRHSASPRLRPCPYCDFFATSDKKLKLHKDKHHPVELATAANTPAAAPVTINPDTNMPTTYLCSFCPKQCSSPQALSKHMKIFHPEKTLGQMANEKVECTQCDLKFPNKYRLQSHIATTHFRANLCVCDTCGMGFRYQRNLDKHLTKHRKGQKGSYVCAICGLDFKYASTLKDHTDKVHSGDNNGEAGGLEQQFKCKYCDVTSCFKAVIKRHEKTHIAEMGHRCEICGNSYANAAGLRRHLKINHGNEKFKCEFCGVEYSGKEYLVGHQKNYCRMKPTTTEEEGTGEGKNVGAVPEVVGMKFEQVLFL